MVNNFPGSYSRVLNLNKIEITCICMLIRYTYNSLFWFGDNAIVHACLLRASVVFCVLSGGIVNSSGLLKIKWPNKSQVLVSKWIFLLWMIISLGYITRFKRKHNIKNSHWIYLWITLYMERERANIEYKSDWGACLPSNSTSVFLNKNSLKALTKWLATWLHGLNTWGWIKQVLLTFSMS